MDQDKQSVGCKMCDGASKIMRTIKEGGIYLYEKTKNPSVILNFKISAEVVSDYGNNSDDVNGNSDENNSNCDSNSNSNSKNSSQQPIISKREEGSIKFRIADAVIFTAITSLAMTAFGALLGCISGSCKHR